MEEDIPSSTSSCISLNRSSIVLLLYSVQRYFRSISSAQHNLSSPSSTFRKDMAAKKELERGRKSIFEIMGAVGYADDKAFREVFRKVTGLSPLNYRNKYTRVGMTPNGLAL